MSKLDQCPSHDHAPAQEREARGSQPGGRQYWRSLDEVVDTQEFRDFLEREFPARASELLDSSRRSFLKVMGASLALAGVASIPGCRRPDHRILPFNTAPESLVPGKPTFYATALPRPGGGAEGVLAKTYEGRPTKIEGNPLHPYSRGKSSVAAQASVLDLYDPDRNPKDQGTETSVPVASWNEFTALAAKIGAEADRNDGASLAFLMRKGTSPARDEMRRRIMERWPSATWVAYEPAESENALAGAMLAYGTAVRPEYRLENARVIVTLDRDLIGEEGGLDIDRGWGVARYRAGTKPKRSAADAEMSRLYAIETRMTSTGGMADHRLPLSVDGVSAFAIMLGDAVLQRAGGGPLRSLQVNLATARGSLSAWSSKIDQKWINAIADDLVAARGSALVVAGGSQPAIVHALTHAINEALMGVGRTVAYRALKGSAGDASSDGLRSMCDEMRSGVITTVVMLNANPVFDAPADLGFGELLAKVSTSVHLGEHDETAAAATMHVAASLPLESWGDVEDFDGTYTVIQPMIAPLWDGHSELEALGAVLGDTADGYAIVQSSFAKRVGLSRTMPGAGTIPNPAFELAWRRCLHDGMLQGSTGSNPEVTSNVRVPRIEAALREAVGGIGAGPTPEALDVVFLPSSRVHDGRWANNGWLQELPEPVTKNTWDNPVLISKATADKLGISPDRHLKGPRYNKVQQCELTIDGRTAVFPIWIQPGLPENTIVVTLGYGRTRAGRIGTGTGVDGYPVRTSKALAVARGATLKPAKGEPAYLIANTQDHWALDGRDVFRETDLYWWRLHGDAILDETDSYGRQRILTGGERLSPMETHAPAEYDIYKRAPGRGSSIYYHKVDKHGDAILDDHGRIQHPDNARGKPIQQWGMSIDLTTCTGCGACTAACQAENNIPVVGKMEVAKGREMHWIRVDRYFSSDTMDDKAYENPSMAIQPVPCMQCESAPCEVVCPVNATVHGREGTNDMAYNRCIGTRYCSNNCPYKVRRFNYFDYATKELDGNYSGRDMLPESVSESVNPDLIPPRLREKVTEVEAMKNNPHVTVRSRGIMEKCTYCVQRINLARVETKLHDLAYIPDGYFQTACQQACPSNSIVFGDIYDYQSNDGKGAAVVAAKNDPRTFAMLAFLNTRPRTTYMARIRNPNEAIRPRGQNPFDAHGHGAGHGGHDDHDHDAHGDQHSDAGRRISLPILTSISGALA